MQYNTPYHMDLRTKLTFASAFTIHIYLIPGSAGG
jgi:hypothetical protein